MDDLTGRIEVLFRRYAAAHELRPSAAVVDRLGKQFRADMDQVIAEYGQAAVDAALDKMPDEAWPSVALH